MLYRNTKTGNVIDIKSEIKGGNWEKVDGGADKAPAAPISAPIAKNEDIPAKRTRKRKEA